MTARQLRDAHDSYKNFSNDEFGPVKLNFSNEEIKEESDGEGYLD